MYVLSQRGQVVKWSRLTRMIPHISHDSIYEPVHNEGTMLTIPTMAQHMTYWQSSLPCLSMKAFKNAVCVACFKYSLDKSHDVGCIWLRKWIINYCNSGGNTNNPLRVHFLWHPTLEIPTCCMKNSNCSWQHLEGCAMQSLEKALQTSRLCESLWSILKYQKAASNPWQCPEFPGYTALLLEQLDLIGKETERWHFSQSMVRKRLCEGIENAFPKVIQ